MCKNNFIKKTLDAYQAPQVSVITLQTEQTILAGSVTPGDFAPGFGFGGDGIIPIG